MKKIAERKKFTNLSFVFSKMARPSAVAILNTTVKQVNTSVCHSAVRKTRSLKMVAKFCRPTNSMGVKPSHFITLNTKEKITGIRMNTVKPIKFGRMKDMPTSVLRVFRDIVCFLGLFFAADGTGSSSFPEKRHKERVGGLRPPCFTDKWLDN